MYYSIERFSHGVTASCLYFTYLPHHAKLQVLPNININSSYIAHNTEVSVHAFETKQVSSIKVVF